MPDLKTRQEKIKEKRKQTSRRDYIKQLCSWQTLVFYKNNNIISRYPRTNRTKGVVNFKDFSENNLLNKGIEFDSSTSFFKNFQTLFVSIDLPSMISFSENENSDFADIIRTVKNVYLSSTIITDCENILYSQNVKEGCDNVLNSVMVRGNCSNIYQSTGVLNSYNVFYSKYINNCSDVYFSTNLLNCKNCMFCNGLENQSYCINNEQYNKEEYNKVKVERLKDKGSFIKWYFELNQIGVNYGSKDTEGNFVQQSENSTNGFLSYQLKNARNCLLVGGTGVNENMYDVFSSGSELNNDFYGVVAAGVSSNNLYLSAHVIGSNLYYSYFLTNCSYCLGCIGLTNKSYCILNRQYEKEEWYAKVAEIFNSMDKDGTLGKFFPGWINPLYFNDTFAYLLDDFSKEEILKDGYLRRDNEIKVDIPEGTETLKTSEVSQYQGFDPDGNWEIDPEILKRVIVDEKGHYYRIVKMEYDFLMKHGLPIPEIHWLDRIKLGFKFN